MATTMRQPGNVPESVVETVKHAPAVSGVMMDTKEFGEKSRVSGCGSEESSTILPIVQEKALELQLEVTETPIKTEEPRAPVENEGQMWQWSVRFRATLVLPGVLAVVMVERRERDM